MFFIFTVNSWTKKLIFLKFLCFFLISYRGRLHRSALHIFFTYVGDRFFSSKWGDLTSLTEWHHWFHSWQGGLCYISLQSYSSLQCHTNEMLLSLTKNLYQIYLCSPPLKYWMFQWHTLYYHRRRFLLFMCVFATTRSSKAGGAAASREGVGKRTIQS